MFKNIKRITYKMALLSFVLITTFMFTAATPAKTAQSLKSTPKSWGLGFGKQGERPSGNETSDYLAGFDAWYIGSEGDGEKKNVYLTFDAGYENGYTDKILDTLKKHEVPAAFFLVGTYLRDNPELVKRIVDEGHIVGNHTMYHSDMTKLSAEEAQKTLTQADDLYKSITGGEGLKYYRPPNGVYSEKSLKIAQDMGYKTVFWSLAYADWDVKKQPSKEMAFSKLLPRLHPGAVLLLHSTSKTNCDIMEEMILKFKEMGYEFKSLND